MPSSKEEEKKIHKMTDNKEDKELHRMADNKEEDKNLQKKKQRPQTLLALTFIRWMEKANHYLTMHNIFSVKMDHDFSWIKIHTSSEAE